MKKIKDIWNRFLQGRHGLDELSKTILIAGMVLYLLGGILQNGLILTLAMMGMIYAIYRALSRNEWDRNEENRKFNRYIKLWRVKYQERKTSRIFMCKGCGRMIRVPKGKGKIQVTCPTCGRKTIIKT